LPPDWTHILAAECLSEGKPDSIIIYQFLLRGNRVWGGIFVESIPPRY
jgi:hypothetical protein